jgi:hypothetical protein
VGIVNRRNALLGWTVLQVAKRMAKRKAMDAVPSFDAESKRPNKSLIFSIVGALAGLAWFWWSRQDDGDFLPE